MFCNLSKLCLSAETAGLIVAIVLASGCGPSAGGGAGQGDGGAGADGSGAPRADAAPTADAAGCGVQEEDIELINQGDPPDLLIVLDRSGSMTTPTDPFDFFGPTRWDAMKDALQTVTQAREMNIRFGLLSFPTDNSCGVSPGADVDIGLSKSAEIVSWMAATTPDGNTPAHLALAEAKAVYESIAVNPAGRYVLFATDGVPNCGDDTTDAEAATVQAVEDLAASGIKTFVLGFGDIFGGLDANILDDAALAGGVPKPGGPPHFYKATSPAELEATLQTIAGGIIVPSCSYALVEQPADPEQVTVTADGVPVPRDTGHESGWDYYPDASTITFFGDICDMVESGSVMNVEFKFGCSGPVVE